MLGELVGDFVAGGPFPRRVTALEQPFHVLGICREDIQAAGSGAVRRREEEKNRIGRAERNGNGQRHLGQN